MSSFFFYLDIEQIVYIWLKWILKMNQIQFLKKKLCLSDNFYVCMIVKLA